MAGVEQNLALERTLQETTLPPRDKYEPGTIVGDKYRIISQTGEGGMGIVYKVEQALVGKTLALKTLRNHAAFDVAFRRFQHEAKAAFALDHPNLISVHDFGVLDDGTPYLVMEFVEGPTLAERLKQVGYLSVEEAVPLFVQSCFALFYAHEKGVVHRDVKPSNILLNTQVTKEESVVKIVDFGLAKFLQHEGGEIQSLTRTGEIFGSPLYMSPEQCLGERVDHRTDVYSLGCVLFETLTGAPPFQGESVLITLLKHQSDAPQTLREASLGREFPEALEAIVARMLAKDPDERYQSLATCAVDLISLTRGDAQNITIFLPPAPARERDDRSRVSMPAGHFFVLIALLVGASSIVSYFIASYIHDRTLVKQVEPPAYARTEGTNDALGLPPVATYDYFDRLHKSDKAIQRAISGSSRDQGMTIHYKGFTREMMKSMSLAKSITTLDLLGCSLDNPSLMFFSHQPIAIANLKYTTLNDVGVDAMKEWKKLAILEVKGTTITDRSARAIAQMSLIRKLDVSETKLTDAALVEIGAMKNLRELYLGEVMALTGGGLSALAGSRVYSLDLTGCNLNDDCIPNLVNMRRLEILNLARTRVSPRGIFELLSNSPGLKEVYLPECPLMTKQACFDLGRRFPSVKVSPVWKHGHAPFREFADDPARKFDLDTD